MKWQPRCYTIIRTFTQVPTVFLRSPTKMTNTKTTAVMKGMTKTKTKKAMRRMNMSKNWMLWRKARTKSLIWRKTLRLPKNKKGTINSWIASRFYCLMKLRRCLGKGRNKNCRSNRPRSQLMVFRPHSWVESCKHRPKLKLEHPPPHKPLLKRLKMKRKGQERRPLEERLMTKASTKSCQQLGARS